MSRLSGVFAKLSQQGRKVLVPYIVAGDPAPELTVPMMHELVAQGADIIELGVPFSDPMAEGPVIQKAHERALVHRVGLRDILGMVAAFRSDNADTPVVLMGYENPVERMGYQNFASAAAAAGVDGLLTVDLPPEECEELTAALAAADIDPVFLIAPTTTEARMRSVIAAARGYIYYVSLKGVTGAGNLDIASVEAQMARIKALTDLPVTVGFGIKDAASATALAPTCEGVVVGSALVDRVANLPASADTAALQEALSLIGSIRQALDTHCAG